MNCGHITGAKPCGVIVGANACLTIGPCAAAGSQSGAIVSDRRSSNQSALMTYRPMFPAALWPAASNAATRASRRGAHTGHGRVHCPRAGRAVVCSMPRLLRAAKPSNRSSRVWVATLVR